MINKTFNEINIDEGIKKRVDTSIPKDVNDYIKMKGYKINDLIRLGILAKEGNPQLIERVRVLEDKFGQINGNLLFIINEFKEVSNWERFK